MRQASDAFPRAGLREVAVRRRPLRAGVLIGAGVGPCLAALMPRTTVVHPEAGSRISVLPVLTRAGIGVRVSRRW